MLGEGDFGVQAVDRARGSPDDGSLRSSGLAELEEDDEIGDVACERRRKGCPWRI